MTPLHWAVEKGHVEVVQLFLKQGADVTCKNKFDKSPLDISISNGRTDIAQQLQLSQTNPIDVTSGEPQVIEEVTTTPTILTEESFQSVEADPVQIVPNSHAKLITASGEEIVVASSGADGTDQSSTSVLATLAALAEATGPLNASNSNASAAEAWNWLETHGITMISSTDAPTLATSSLEGGQTLSLTEAGKLALSYVKKDSGSPRHTNEETEVVEETVETLENVVTDEDGQRVIAIVEDQSQVVDGTETIMVVPDEEGETICEETVDEESMEPSSKRLRIELSEDSEQDSNDLKRQLEAVQRKAEEYKAQLQEKSQEAEVYKKQLNEINAKAS